MNKRVHTASRTKIAQWRLHVQKNLILLAGQQKQMQPFPSWPIHHPISDSVHPPGWYRSGPWTQSGPISADSRSGSYIFLYINAGRRGTLPIPAAATDDITLELILAAKLPPYQPFFTPDDRVLQPSDRHLFQAPVTLLTLSPQLFF